MSAREMGERERDSVGERETARETDRQRERENRLVDPLNAC